MTCSRIDENSHSFNIIPGFISSNVFFAGKNGVFILNDRVEGSLSITCFNSLSPSDLSPESNAILEKVDSCSTLCSYIGAYYLYFLVLTLIILLSYKG